MNPGARADSEGAFFFHNDPPWNDGTERYKDVRNVSGMDYRKMCLPYQRMRVSASTISGRYFYICRKEVISTEN